MGLAASGVFLLVAAWAWSRIRGWRRKSPQELERLRRLAVHRRGRIATGIILDLIEPETQGSTSRLIAYKYEVAGVTYEAAQDVSALPGIASAARSFAGHTASIKYDPKRPMNSIIACEEWNGAPGIKPAPGPATEQAPNPSEALKAE